MTKAGGQVGPRVKGVNDDRCSPESVLSVVRMFAPITLDPCSNPHSTVGASTSLSLENGDDGLVADWEALAGQPGLVFVNPPWSSLYPWARKCVRVSMDTFFRTEIIWLARAESATEWSQLLHRNASAMCMWSKRVGYPKPGDTGKITNDVQSSMLFYFGNRVDRFNEMFRPYGIVYKRLP